MALTWRAPVEVVQAVRATKALTSGPLNANFVLEFDVRDRFQAALDEGVEVVSFFWGDPGPMVQDALRAGVVPITIVGSVDEAKRAADCGSSVIVAQGWEAGGHVRGEVTTGVLVPAIVDLVATIPVLAAGGIADARGVAAALALGAAGVWVGTRFVASREADAHPQYQGALLQASATDTVHSKLFDGGWANAALRTLRNSTVRELEAAGRPPPGRRPRERQQGAEAMALYAGQCAGLIREILPAADIVAELARGVPVSR